MAAIVAEALPHFGVGGWEIAAFPFRFHQVAFDQLEKWRQTGEEPTEIPGRTGVFGRGAACATEERVGTEGL